MGGHLEVDELTTAVADEEEDVEGPEGEGLHDKEVGRPDRLSLVSQEGSPALAGRVEMTPTAVAADRAGADHDAELEELATDPLGAPEWVLAGHGCDQLTNLGTQSGPA